MIPLCAREKIVVDDGEVKYFFRPKIGSLEYDLATLFETIKKDTASERVIFEETDELFTAIIVGWQGEGMPAFDELPASHFSNAEKIRLILAWAKANAIDDEQKKS
jgi:hypothetical protein